MEKDVKEFPIFLRNSLKALNDESRQNILLYLLKESSKSFVDISKDLSISKNNLSHHIKTLMRYGLIYNFYDKNKYKNKHSFYELSKFGKKIVMSLIELISPNIEEQEESTFEVVTYVSGKSTDDLLEIPSQNLISAFVTVTTESSSSGYCEPPLEPPQYIYALKTSNDR